MAIYGNFKPSPFPLSFNTLVSSQRHTYYISTVTTDISNPSTYLTSVLQLTCTEYEYVVVPVFLKYYTHAGIT